MKLEADLIYGVTRVVSFDPDMYQWVNEEDFYSDLSKTVISICCDVSEQMAQKINLEYGIKKYNNLTKSEALAMMEKINQANHNKKPYVRVGERQEWIKEIENSPYTLYSYVNVYSKSWSRRICKLVNAGGKYYNLREARKILA